MNIDIKKISKKVVFAIIIIASLIYLSSLKAFADTNYQAGNFTVGENKEEEVKPIKPPEITLNKTSATIIEGKTVTLKLFNTTKKPSFSSSNKKIATVSSSGVVKGIKKGTVTISVKLSGKTYKCKVKVERPKISHTSRTLVKGASYKMSFSGTTIKATWSSSNKKIVTIDANGKMVAKKKGSATITGKISGKSYKCKIKVESPSLNTTSKTLVKGKTYTLKLKGTNRKVKWKSYNKKIATVSSKGKVTSKKAGTVKISASVGGKEFIANIKVVNKGFEKSSVVLTKGNTYTPKTYGLSGSKKWSSSKTSVATVSSNGKITAKGKGTATITLKNGSKKYKLTVTVEDPYMTVSKGTIIKDSNSTFKMNGTSKSVTWSSSKPSVATVNSKGLVTGKNTGTATISAIVDKRKFSYKITVKDQKTYTGWIEKNNKSFYYQGGKSVKFWQTINGRKYCFNEDGELISKFGIDVSKYQKTIDWKKAKDDGVEFAMIRLGYRGYGKEGTLVTDEQFKNNINGVKANNIDYGIYFFTQATNEAEGEEEAKYVLKVLKECGASPKYPIVIDSEASSDKDNDGRADKISKIQRSYAVKAFCDEIKEAGYTPMIYASKNWFKTHLDMTGILKDYNDVWVAHYTSGNNITDYSGSYGIWQYTSTGKVNGIKGNCDLDVAIKNYK